MLFRCFDIRVGEKMCVILSKILKSVLKLTYQTGSQYP